MSITSYDYVTVQAEFVTVDVVVWRRYRIKCIGILEATLDCNPHLAKLHKTSPFLPVGTQIKVPIDLEILAGAPQPKTTVLLWGTRKYPYSS